MPWNEPGDPSKNKDPWTGRPKQTPPDLEAFLRDLCKKIVALFKLRIFNKKSAIMARSFSPAQLNAKAIGVIAIVCLLAWLALGFFKVNTEQQAIVTQFGKYSATFEPGYHWVLRPIQQYTRVDTGKMKKFSTTVQLLTEDENKISVDLSVDYSIVNGRDYLFSTAHPLLNLQEIIHNAANRVLSQFTLAQLQANSHFLLQERLQQQLDSAISQDKTGLTIKNVTLAAIQVPEQLQASLLDVANAKKDKEQLENQAKAYAIQIEPNAKAKAQRLIADAKAYQQKIILTAKIETTRFLALLPAYQASPTLTRQRLYLEALQNMMAHSNKLVMANTANAPFSLTFNNPVATQAINTSKLSELSTSAKTNTTNEASSKTNNAIPSSYDIAGGYE
ncbi:MAG: HflK protein [Pseudomonadota bacterium]|jgi:membrane protease subunit HflK